MWKNCPSCGWKELEVVILCGGKGTRMGEARLRPKKLAFDVDGLAEYGKQVERQTAKAILFEGRIREGHGGKFKDFLDWIEKKATEK